MTAVESTTRHTLTIEVIGAKTWLDVEARAADVARAYFLVPGRGRNAEGINQLLAGAEVEVHVGADGFDAVLKVSR